MKPLIGWLLTLDENNWLVVSHIFYCSLLFGEDEGPHFDVRIFVCQMGWFNSTTNLEITKPSNHQTQPSASRNAKNPRSWPLPSPSSTEATTGAPALAAAVGRCLRWWQNTPRWEKWWLDWMVFGWLKGWGDLFPTLNVHSLQGTDT